MTDKFNSSLNSALSEGRVSHVIDVLTRKCAAAAESHPDAAALIPRLQRVADTYSRLRDFMLDSLPDPERPRVLAALADELRAIALDFLFIANEDRPDPFFADYRLQKLRGRALADLVDELRKTDHRHTMARVTEADPSQFLKKMEDAVGNIFLKVWSLPPWAKEDLSVVRSLLVDSAGDDGEEPGYLHDLRAQLISALLLGLLKFYDPAKFLLLIDAYNNAGSDRIAARALTAIVLVLARYGNAVLYDAAVSEALNSLSDSLISYTRLRDVVATLIKTRDTDRVTREVNDAFQTTMRNISPDILEKMSRGGMAIDAGETGMNPEWEKLMKNNKELEENMQRINDMQLEGLDVMMQTFSRLKSFPFFRSLPNWFLPFSTSHSEVAHLFEKFDSEALHAMARATDMCASDCFSFSFGILQMPEERRNLLAASVGAQLEGLKDMVKDRNNVRQQREFAKEALVFARDLYRFAKIYPARGNFYDPFESPLDFLRLPVVGSMLENDGIVISMADFYFQHGYYSLALGLYSFFVSREGGDRSVFERMGYCCQMEGDFASALDYYEKADLFSSDVDPSSTWLLKKLAFVNKALGFYSRSAEFYRKVLERNPDDLNLQYHLGSVLLRAGDVNAARELLAKVNYLNPDHKLCSRLYTRLKGHDAFLAGRYREAADLYAEAMGEASQADFRRDIMAELALMDKDYDLRTLQLLLDN